MVIAYIMREEQLAYPEALLSVVAIRPGVQPNPGFSRQLAWYSDNGCPVTLKDRVGRHYRSLNEFAQMVRRYSATDVRAAIRAAGVDVDGDGADMAECVCRDRRALQRGLDALDRLQNAQPLDESARIEKRRQSRRLDATLEQVLLLS